MCTWSICKEKEEQAEKMRANRLLLGFWLNFLHRSIAAHQVTSTATTRLVNHNNKPALLAFILGTFLRHTFPPPPLYPKISYVSANIRLSKLKMQKLDLWKNKYEFDRLMISFFQAMVCAHLAKT
jgi:hypothetical protein